MQTRARLNFFKPWSTALTPHIADITISVHCLGWGSTFWEVPLSLSYHYDLLHKDPSVFPGGGKPISCQGYPFLLTHGDNLRSLHLFNPVTWNLGLWIRITWPSYAPTLTEVGIGCLLLDYQCNSIRDLGHFLPLASENKMYTLSLPHTHWCNAARPFLHTIWWSRGLRPGSILKIEDSAFLICFLLT